MTASVDIHLYSKLWGEDRDKFDKWLRDEGLVDRKISSFVLGDGYIDATVSFDLPRSTRMRVERIPISNPPPVILYE
jgi:hypothetical protein